MYFLCIVFLLCMLLTHCTICYVQDDEYRGKGTTIGHHYFRCGHKNGVWVSMDMVIYPPTTTGQHTPHNSTVASKSSYDTSQQTPHVHKTAHQYSSSALNIVSKAWNYLTGNDVEYKEQQRSEIFKEGDCVIAYSLKDQRPITATVCWIGMVRLSQEGQVPKAMFAGLETVSCIISALN